MDKKELLKEAKRWQADYLADMAGYLSSEDKEKVNNALKEIVGLISAHSEEAEVGNEEREGLEIWLDKLVSAASGVMCGLRDHGASIVPHYLDNDENEGQRLRECLAELGKKVKIDKLIRQRRTVSREEMGKEEREELRATKCQIAKMEEAIKITVHYLEDMPLPATAERTLAKFLRQSMELYQEQKFDVNGQKLSRAEFLQLRIEKKREILEKQAKSAKEYYDKKDTEL